MINQCVSNLNELKTLLQKLKGDDFTKPISAFNESTIGQHFRHIIEFYTSIINLKEGQLNYEDRERNLQIETDVSCCIAEIENLLLEIVSCNKDFELKISLDFGQFTSSFQRELLYVLEHSIHHQALIKIGLAELKKSDLVSPEFGVAPSTSKFREQCAP